MDSAATTLSRHGPGHGALHAAARAVHAPAAQQRRPAHRLPGWQRRALYLSGAALLLSGAGWLALHYAVGASAGGLPHPLEAWAMRLHGLAAFGGLFMLGALAASHVPQGWRMARHPGWSRQRAVGAALCALAAALASSGYLLYYFAPEAVRPALGWAHSVAGVALGLLLLWHRRGQTR